MKHIKLIAEGAILIATLAGGVHHHKVEPVKKPAIIKPSGALACYRMVDCKAKLGTTQPDTPTTTVPPVNSISQDKGGFSAPTPPVKVSNPPPLNQAAPVTPTTVNEKLTPPTTQIIKNITFYGWPDNDPPGANIAYPVIHNKAGGAGTYSDPLTFATKSTFPKGTILYVPYIQKYVIMEDECASCGASHIDIWMPSDGNFNKQVLACENKWTRTNQEVILNPPSDEPLGVSLFDVSTGICA